jgi:serine/threonine-protein kinase
MAPGLAKLCMMRAMQITPGAVIAGRYRADRKIGSGAMGEVWAGENIAVGYKVAIKTMLEAAAVDPEVVARFKREAFILGRIRSDFVARVLDFASDEKYGLVLILDLIEGDPFSDVLKRTKLTVEEAIEVGTDVVSGLRDLHQSNIVHRDLKPSNIILEPRADGTKRATIVDFGVSRLMKGSNDEEEEITNITRADMALGTLEYMAPEQMLDSRNVTGASDLYAVGAMLYRAVAGRHAFGNLADVELARSKLLDDTPPLVTGRADPVAKRYERIIGRALKRRPADRYKNAEEMLVDLAALRDLIRKPKDAHAPPMIEDEATVDMMMAELSDMNIDVEESVSFQRFTPAPQPRASSSSQAATTKSPAGAKPAAAQPAASQPAAAQPAPRQRQQSLSSIDLTPPPRSGVPVALVVILVLAAVVGGIALGMTVFLPPPPNPVFDIPPPTFPEAAAPTGSASASAPGAISMGAADGGLDAASDAASDAAADAADDAGRDASTPFDAGFRSPLGIPAPSVKPLPGAPTGPRPSGTQSPGF